MKPAGLAPTGGHVPEGFSAAVLTQPPVPLCLQRARRQAHMSLILLLDQIASVLG